MDAHRRGCPGNDDADTASVRRPRQDAPWEERLLQLLTPQRLPSLPAVWRYGLAVVLVAAATLLRWALIPWLGTTAPYSLTFVTLVLTTVWLGIGPGLLFVLLGNVAVELYITGALPAALNETTLLRLLTAMTSGALVGGMLHFIRIAQIQASQSEARYRVLLDLCPDAILVHADGKFVFANPAALRLFGARAPQELLGQDVLERISPSDRPLVAQRIAEAYGGAVTPLRETQFLRLDDSIIEAEVTGARIEFGGRPAIQIALRDVTQHKEAVRAIQSSRQTLETVVNHMPAAVCLIRGRDLRLQLVNPAYQTIAPGKEMVGRTLDELWPETGQDFSALCRRVVETGEPYQVEDELNLIRRRPDGPLEPAYFNWSLHRVRLPGDEGWGILNTAWETTERKRAEEAIHRAHEQLGMALRGAGAGSWAWDIPTGKLAWSEELFELLGLDSATQDASLPRWEQVLHPEDRAAAWARIDRAMNDRTPLASEYRIVRGDGQIRWISAWGQAVYDRNGTPVRMAGICIDITERKQAEEALAAAKAAAEAANAAKGRFLANMSHELRTPMNAILGMIDVALAKAVDPTVQDCLRTAKGSADLLLTLLNDLLDSAKIESGKLELESAAFSLRRMLDQLTRVMAIRASEKGLVFSCRVPEETPDVVVGDRMRLQQVLLNLASNAIKFTERGEVEIGLRSQPQEGEVSLEFAVRDTGMGIPPSGQKRLFQPFAQADASTSRRFGGTGLGLSISKSLVEMMGGRIWVESEVGRGSTFFFTVPLPLAQELPADSEAPVALPGAACGPLRILLVEDNPANQKLATYVLQDRGHAVEIAEDGPKALDMTERHRYDVILMDVQMPGMNGLETTAALRKREGPGHRVPIIAMTAHAMKGDRERCLAAGMDGYLSKPVSATEMIGLVERLGGSAASLPPRTVVASSLVGSASQTAAVVFNPQEALARCFNSPDILREMIQDFFAEADSLFPQMREALAKGDLVEVGRLGHRLKGTVAYLGANPAKQAALGVERFCKSTGGTPAEAEEAIRVLEHECLVLRGALAEHAVAAETE